MYEQLASITSMVSDGDLNLLPTDWEVPILTITPPEINYLPYHVM